MSDIDIIKANDEFSNIIEAYKVLYDPDERAKYDSYYASYGNNFGNNSDKNNNNNENNNNVELTYSEKLKNEKTLFGKFNHVDSKIKQNAFNLKSSGHIV